MALGNAPHCSQNIGSLISSWDLPSLSLKINLILRFLSFQLSTIHAHSIRISQSFARLARHQQLLAVAALYSDSKLTRLILERHTPGLVPCTTPQLTLDCRLARSPDTPCKASNQYRTI